MNEEKALELYNFSVKENYDLGDFENFKLVLLNKDRGVELHSFFENEGYDVGSVNDFVLINNDPLKKKEESILPSQESNVELASGLEENTTVSSDTSPTSIADIPAYQPDIQQPIASDTTAMFNTDTNQPEVDSNKEDSYTGVLDDNGNPLDPQDYNLFTEKADTFEETVDKSVTPEMISSVEEVVVPEMNYKFNRYGFEFTQKDITGDEMLVKSANGKELKVELDALFFAGDYSEELKSFLRENKEESERLHKILNKDIKDENVFQNKKQIDNTLKIFNYETENFEKEVTDYKNVQKKLDITYEENFKGLSDEELNSPELKEKLEKYNLLVSQHSEIQKGLVEKNKEFTAKGKRIDRLAGEYFEMQSEQGSWGEGVINSALDGVSGIASGVLDAVIDASTLGSFKKEDIIKEARAQGTVPKELQGDGILENLSEEDLIEALGGSTFNWFTSIAKKGIIKLASMTNNPAAIVASAHMLSKKKDGEIEPETSYDKAASAVRDRARKDIKFGEDKYRNPYSQEAFDFDNELGLVDASRKGTRDVLGFESTTEAWTESNKEGFWGGAFLGLAESIPAMIGGKGPVGWATRTAQMYAQVSDGVSKEMGSNAFFDDITETEKAMVKMPIGIAVGVLESIGFSNIMKQTGLVNSLVGRALSKVVSKDMSKSFATKNFAEFIRQDVENMIAKGLLTISAAGLAEFETGALQEIAEVGIKDIYNAAKDSKIFDTPDTWNQWVGQVLKAGAQEAVGGFVMGSPGAVSTSMSGLSAQKLDNSVFEMFEKVSGDPTYFNMYVSKLKQRILNPESDTDLASAKKELDDVNQLRGLLPKIPVHYTTDQKKVALQLLMQKHSLENEIGVEDKTLSKAKQELLDKVNDKLASIENDVVNENNKNNVDATLIQDFNEGDVEVESKEERSNNVTPEEAADIETFFEGDVSEANESGNEVSNPNLTINRSESSNLNGRQKAAQNTIIKIANFGAKSISKILPNVRIVLHENNDDFLKFSKNGEGRAEYNPSNNVIHINLSSATKTTVPHEIFHAIIIDKIKSDPAIQKATEKMMVSVRKTLSKDSDLAIAIDKFAESYSDGIQNEERLAELIGILSSSAGRELSKPTKNAIVRWVTEIAKKFGINLGTNFGKNDSDVIDLLNTIARKTRKGEVIEESDVKSLKPEEKIEESTPIEEEQEALDNLPEDTDNKRDTSKEIEEGLSSMGKGFIQAANERAAKLLQKNGKLSYNKKESAEAARNNPHYNTIENSQGGVDVIGIYLEETDTWVGTPSKDLIKKDTEKSKERVEINVGDKFNYSFGIARDGIAEVVGEVDSENVTVRFANGVEMLQKKSLLIQYLNNETYDVFTEITALKPSPRQQRLAPNGKVSNLNEVQYNLVRTPEFKKWFGDWEINPKESSKVLDKNGEPLVVYHGSNATDIDVFDRSESKRISSEVKEFGTFFSTNEFLSEKYAKAEKTDKYKAELHDRIIKLKKLKEESRSNDRFNEYAEAEKELTEELESGNGKVYPLFLNIRNIKTFDAKFDNNIEAWDNLKVKADYKVAENRQAMEFLKFGDFGVKRVDGIKAENILDYNVKFLDSDGKRYRPLFLDKKHKESKQYQDAIKEFGADVYLMFDDQSENIKLADGSNKTFNPTSPSIRQQMSLETISRYHNLNVDGFFPDRADIPKIRKAVESLGYGLKKSKTDEYGRGGNYFIVNSKGAKVNPLKSKVRQQKAITDIVKEGRENNFKDPQIRDFLVRVKKFSAKEVDRIMKVNIDLLQLMPKSFGNIEGGAKAGVKLFKKINDFRAKLTKKNNELKEDDRISEQEIIDQTIEFLEKQPEYINESDTYTQGSKKKGTKVTKRNKQMSSQQASMVIDIQSSIGIRPTQQMAARLREARIALSQRTKGRRDLNKIKIEVRNFIRKSLPKSIYGTPKVVKLINLVTDSNKDNINNILDQVAKFVIEHNIENLEAKLDKILSGKLQANQSGRKKGNRVDNATRKRIKKIKKEIDKYKEIKENSDTYADEILEINEKLNLEFNELQKNAVQTEETLNRMVDIQLIMEYNNSLLMDNNDSNKVTELDSIVSTLQEIIDYGRSALKEEMREAHAEYLRQFALGYYTITGNKIDTSNKEEMEKALANEKYDRDNDAQRKKLKGKIVSFASKIYTNTLDGVFGTAEALDGLMSKIDMLPGEMFGGNLQEMFTEKIDESTRVFKGRKMLVEGSIQNKLIELYGKRWAKRSRENRVKKPTGIYKNDKAKTDGRDLILSQNQMAYLYNQYKDPANRGSFETKYGVEYKRVMEEIEAKIDPNVKELADWQVNEFYPSLYSHYNEAYKKIYRTDMPWNQFYAGMIYREGIEKEPINMLANESIQNTSVGASSTKFRVNNNLEISDKDMVDVMASYVNEMEYFAAYSESVRDMNKLFTNKYIASAITNIHGKITYNLIQDMIQKIAAKGTPNSLGDNIVNKMNDVFIISRLALSPVVMIKQLTSFITYANDIGFGNYIKYAAKNKAQQVKIWKEVRDNSVYLQDRGNDSILRTIETYSEETMKKFIPEPAKDFVVNFMMWTTKFGDKTAIMVGGLPNYSFYKAKAIKNGATEQEAIQIAIRKFERDTKRTQQSSDLQDKDRSQNKNAVYRALNMFMTTPKQYLRKEVQSVRNISRKLRGKGGKGTYLENIRTLVMYHVVMPVFFQYVSLGLPGLLRDFRDDDDDDLLRAAIIGNLNALFILGEVVATIGDYMTNKPWAGSSVKAVGMIQIVNSIVLKANKARNVKDPEKKAKYMKDVYLDLVTGLGIPAPTINKFVENYGAIGSDGDIGKDILRILNYSKYQQEGSGKSKKKKKTKTISEINNEYRKEEAKNNKAKSKIINGSFSSDKGFSNEGYSGGGF